MHQYGRGGSRWRCGERFKDPTAAMRAFGVKNCSKPSDLRNWEHKLAALAEHESKGARLTLAEEIYATELHAKNAAMDAAERQARQKAAAQQQAHEDASWVPHGARGGPTTHTAVRGPGSENKVAQIR